MKIQKKKKKKLEWSKIFCAIVAFGFGIYGVWCGVEYYILARYAILMNGTMPDSTLAVVSVSTVIASLLSYLLYQLGLKTSRNKYGIGSDGEPFRVKENTQNDEEEGGAEG